MSDLLSAAPNNSTTARCTWRRPAGRKCLLARALMARFRSRKRVKTRLTLLCSSATVATDSTSLIGSNAMLLTARSARKWSSREIKSSVALRNPAKQRNAWDVQAAWMVMYSIAAFLTTHLCLPASTAAFAAYAHFRKSFLSSGAVNATMHSVPKAAI